MHTLVTGGAGFIGSHVVEALLARGDEVTILDDLNDFYDPALKEANLREIGAFGAYGFRLADVCDAGAVGEIMDAVRPDVVIHLAARAGVRPSLLDPLLYERVNVRGTLSLLEACRKRGVKRFVFASSSSVYGNNDRAPYIEDKSATMPISPYAATKLAGEHLCYTYSHLYGIACICLRFFTVFGPRQRPDLAIRKFAGLIERGEPIPVFGDGSMARDYTYVSDTVAGVLAAINCPSSYEVINLGNSRPISLADLIAHLERELGRKAVIRRLPTQDGDVRLTCADIAKAARLLGYHPSTPFETGLQHFVGWLRRPMEAEHFGAGR
jgi:UDP-glucuronate 4-epimerase